MERPKLPGRRAAALLLAAVLTAAGAWPAWAADAPARLPEFSDRSQRAWINSPPLSRGQFAGKVVLIELWSLS